MQSAILPFVLTSLAIELTPGPNMGYLAVLSVERGRMAGLAAVGGIAMGLLVLGLLAGFGLGTVVSQTRWLYESVRWAGVALLLWLAWDSYREARRPIETEAASRNPWGDFGRGLATNLLNPKAAVFYVAVLPNFVASDYPVGRQSLILTLIYVGIATLIHAAIVLAASTLQPLLSSAMVRRRTGIVFALLLAAIAGWVAITTHRSW